MIEQNPEWAITYLKDRQELKILDPRKVSKFGEVAQGSVIYDPAVKL